MKNIYLLILLTIFFVTDCKSKEPFPLFELYVNDTMNINAYLVTQNNIHSVFFHEKHIDLTYDHMVYVLRKSSYTLYVPKLKTAFNVSSKEGCDVGEHLCWLIQQIRQYNYFQTSKQQHNEREFKVPGG